MAKKELILDSVHYALGADAQNVDYTNAGMTGVTDAKGALDNLHSRVGEIEHPNTDIIFTEADCTIENSYVYTNGGVNSNNSYNCSDYIVLPVCVKMYLKVNYILSNGILFFTQKANGDYSWMTGKNIVGVGPYDDFTEIQIPDNAIAFRFSHNKSSDDNHISIKFAEIKAMQDVVKLKVAAWNIGGLAGGGTSSTITNENADAKRRAYRKQFDMVNADILCISEYCATFNTSTSSLTKDEILCNYPYYKLGSAQAYNFNCVFSKFPILHTREIGFVVKDQNRYIKEVTMKFNNKVVKVVTTHLEFNAKYVDELQQLIELYANDPYVIIGADFNIHIDDTWGAYVDGSGTDGYKNYQYLTDAGYTLMRFDYLDNDMLPNPLSQSTADNIAVKGFTMGKREFVYEQGVSETLSDHCMISCELVML